MQIWVRRRKAGPTTAFGRVLVTRPNAVVGSALAHCIHAADEDVFPNMRVLLIIACTIPVSSCEEERSFSALRRIKSYLQSTMSSERFAGLALMHLHSDVDIEVTV